MQEPAPQIDPRTAREIADQVGKLLRIYIPEWQEFDPITGEPKGTSAALIGVFARLGELIIQRLNQVPEKNFLAFLDLLGASRLPPQPARAPLTFSLAAGSATDAVVPAGTQVAAPPAEGETEPVIFETERELVVTAVQLTSLFVRDPQQDRYDDYGSLVAAPAAPEVPVFRGERSNEHILYLGHSLLLGFSQISDLRLIFNLNRPLGDGARLHWQIWNGTEWEDKVPLGAPNLTQEGNNPITFGASNPAPLHTVASLSDRWLRCRLVTPITQAEELLSGMVRESRLPEVSGITMEVELHRPVEQGLAPELAFTNNLPVDLGKDFFPFGEQPKLNDTHYLASGEAFSKDGAGGLAPKRAEITLAIELANSHLLPMTTSVRPTEDLQVAWECWDGTAWHRLGTGTPPNWLSLLELEPVAPLTTDETVVIQGIGQRGAVVAVEAVEHRNMTVIGEDGHFADKVTLIPGVNVITATARYQDRTSTVWAVTFRETDEQKQTVQLLAKLPERPVTEEKIPLEVIVKGEDTASIQRVRVTNGAIEDSRVEQPPGQPLPLTLAEGRNALLIEGLDQASERRAAATTALIGRQQQPPATPPAFYDGTHGFSQSGTVILQLPDKVASHAVNGEENYWLRVRLVGGDYGKPAAYRLKDPTTPEEGFTLVPASFRPPVIAGVKIGYRQTLRDAPKHRMVYNNQVFATVTASDEPFRPFYPAPEARPTFYMGFILPPGRQVFPNRTISLFARLADFHYGERTVPLWPDHARASAAPGATVTHIVWVTNATTEQVRYPLNVFGTRWPAVVVPSELGLAAGEAKPVEVRVTIPEEAATGERDQGFVELILMDNPPARPSTRFTTFVGTQTPLPERLELSWEYWDGTGWSALRISDGTENFTRTGVLQFLAPADFARRNEFGLDRYWLRVSWKDGEFRVVPRLRRVLINTTLAAQTVTRREEILGSSDGGVDQRFHTTRTPILPGQQLEVREPELPSAEEQARLKQKEGEDAISVNYDSAGHPQTIWVRWHEVADFHASRPRDRHYVLDRLSGELRFGNGLHGLIPPLGANNIRMARYQTGGGEIGNRPVDTIVQLKTTVPYVDQVTNPEPAAGGAQTESLTAVQERIPRTLRHRGRAVTPADYEDLARIASPRLARAKCVPLYDLILDPDAEQRRPGVVSLIIMPRSTDARPMPSLELIERVQGFIQQRQIDTADLIVVGPEYIRVDIEAQIAVRSLEGAAEVERTVVQTLSRFLHPLMGGPEGEGWDFGRKPHKSDLYALLEEVAGVDHIRTLKVSEIETRVGAANTGRFLVYSGTHIIRLIFEET